ncbi:MAG: sulfite exporter TauE/SafE family protein [Methanosarcinales archaeon]
MSSELIILLFGIAIGTTIGMIGNGGVVLILFFMNFKNLNINTAMGTALATFIGTGILGTIVYNHKNHVDWKSGILLSITGIFGAFIGTKIGVSILEKTLNTVFAIFLLILSIFTIIRGKYNNININLINRFNNNIIIAIGFFAGIASGLFGIGGPAIVVPLLINIGFPMLVAVGTSQLDCLFASLSGAISHALHGYINYKIAILAGSGELIGIVIGWKLANYIGKSKEYILKTIVAFALIGMAMYMILL